MRTAQHSSTGGHGTVGKGWTPSRGTRVVPVRDSRALTALRVATYLLASLTCLVILSGVACAAVLLRDPTTLNGLTRLVP